MDGYWCKFNNIHPELRFDPLQSFSVDHHVYGHRVSIVSTRGERPVETKRPTPEQDNSQKTQSILQKIIRGKELSIPISGDATILGTPFDDPQYHQLEDYQGVCIVNKYAALDSGSSTSPGVALVSFSSQFTMHLDQAQQIYEMLLPMKTAIISLVPSENPNGVEFKSSIIFLNIGPTSGASINQLHAQAYVLDSLHGSISYLFQKSYEQSSKETCLICELANQSSVTDHLGQTINVQDHVLWEDPNVRLVHPYAPIRPFSLRIYLKRHTAHFVELSADELRSISVCFTIVYKVVSGAAPRKWRSAMDRSIAIRQAIRYDADFHIFIDLLSTIPIGAAEIVDSLSISSSHPEKIASRMREVIGG